MAMGSSTIQGPNVLYLERLGFWRMVRLVFCHRGAARTEGSQLDFRVIDQVSRGARLLGGCLRGLGIHVRMEELHFDFGDQVKLPNGTCAMDEIYFRAVPALFEQIERDPAYREVLRLRARRSSDRPSIHAYLSKRIFLELYPGLRSILVAAWHVRRSSGERAVRGTLYLRKDYLLPFLSTYAARWGIGLNALPAETGFGSDLCQSMRFQIKRAGRWFRGTWTAVFKKNAAASPRVAVEVYFNGIRKEPIYHSDFFWHRSPGLPPGALFGYFLHPKDQPTRERKRYLEENGIGWVDRKTLLRQMDFSMPDEAWSRIRPGPSHSSAEKVLQRYVGDFYWDYERWRSFFAATGTRIHVSTADVFPSSEALHAALKRLGGISVSIQKSIEREPYLLRRTVTDVHFAGSKSHGESERLSGSRVEQFIVAGYPFDDAFALARQRGEGLAQRLRAHGVQFIVCFLDENEGIQPKRFGGVEQTREDYRFLCDRLASDETLGMILKPKRSQSLPARLGPVWARVQEWIEQGRLILLHEESPDRQYLPCVAACAAHVAINPLCGGTAGLESYLAGTPTLLIRHDVDPGIFRKLPAGSVVFDTWEELWRAVERLRSDPSDRIIGNWEPIEQAFVSWRDGKTSQRIGGYVQWLYEALAAGRTREEAMEEAARRYAAVWGNDWITLVRPPAPFPENHEGSHVEAVNVDTIA